MSGNLFLEKGREFTERASIRDRLLHDDGGLPRNLEPFSAAHVLAGHHVVFPHHVGTEFREAGPVALIGSSPKLALFGAYHPGHLVLRRLVTMRAIQRSRFLFLPLIKKIALFHSCRSTSSAALGQTELLHT